jgi:hypothetical protein
LMSSLKASAISQTVSATARSDLDMAYSLQVSKRERADT